VKKTIALDPWLDPLPAPFASTHDPAPLPPILVINSPGFTIWDEHFARLLRKLDQTGGSLMTVLGASRMSTFHCFANR